MSFVLKKISEIRRSKKFSLSLIVSYMIIMGILFATMVLTYLRTEDELEAQMCDNIYRNMDSILSTLESKICSLTTIVYSVENSEVLSQMLENEKETISNYAAYRMSQFIGNIKTNEIDTLYCYFPQYDYCISNNDASSSHEFFEKFYGKDGSYSFEQWCTALNSFAYSTYFITTDSEGNRYIDFLFTSPVSDVLSPINYSCVIRFSDDYIKSVIETYMQTEDRNIYILDKNDDIIYENVIYNNIAIDNYNSYLSNKKFYLNSNLHMSKQFSINNWQMILIMPIANIHKELVHLRVVIVFMMFASLILSLILAKGFTNVHYNPIKQLLNITPNYGQMGDFERLEKALEQFKEQRNVILPTMYNNEVLERNNFLGVILSGHTDRYLPLDVSLERYGIRFISDTFCVTVFYIKDENMLFCDLENEEAIDGFERANTILFIIKNVFEELMNEKHYVNIFEYQGLIVALININQENITSWKADIEENIKKLYDFVKENFQFSFVAGTSNLHNGISKLNGAFSEATDVFNYRTQIRNAPLIFADLQTKAKDNKYGGLTNAIVNGNYAVARQIYQAQMSKDGDIFDFISGVIAAVQASDRISADSKKYILEKTAAALQQQNGSDALELLEYVCSICQSRGGDTADKKETCANGIIEKIKLYVGENYSNESLNVSMVGDHFDITPYYLSSIFKNAEGKSILEYITQTRLERSLKLLADGETVVRAANAVGYSSVHTYIRLFTKYMGCSPKEYKAAHKNTEAE